MHRDFADFYRDFLTALVINTNLHPVLHRFQVIGQIFASDRGVPHF